MKSEKLIITRLAVFSLDLKDFTFDEEDTDPGKIVRKTDASTQTLATDDQSRPTTALINSQKAYHSSTGLCQRSTMYNSLSPFTRSKYSHFNFNLPSPSVETRELPTSESCPVRLGSRRSQSVGHLPGNRLNVKLTDDSGTGDSLDPLPLRATSKHYESVPIYEQDTSALISNRYDFIRSKVDEYRRQKGATRPILPTMTLPEIPEWQSDQRDKKRSGGRPPSATGNTKSTRLLSRVMKLFRSP